MAKYDSLRKISRNKRVYNYHKKHPEKSMQELADKYGVSKTRICQIIHAGGITW